MIVNRKYKSHLPALFVFLVSLIVYILTLEPTTSFWDCSEFIACAYKLEVGHAPGAPFFMLLGRFFSLFSGGNTEAVAYTINLLSAIASALTIYFLYYTIKWFGEKILNKAHKESDYNTTIVVFSAVVGALSFAFTDTFWFSAVEGEVYATSSLFTTFVFWAILKWETKSDTKFANRWILLIVYLTGISIGVHLLNLLAVPSIVLVYYFKRYKVTRKGVLLSLLLAFGLLGILMFIIVPGVAKLTAYFDLLFVNSFKLPVYSGAVFFIALLFGLIGYGIYVSVKKQKVMLNTLMLSALMLLLGYSSYVTLVIRSVGNPYIDISNVENIFGLVNYLNREQYGKRPLIYGNNYNSPVVKSKERYTYMAIDGKYVKDNLNPEYKFDERTLTLFPRMASIVDSHGPAYEEWIDIKGRKVTVKDNQGKQKVIKVPTFGDNLKFFFKYQLGHMYMRYFMWNFSGRQNNIQGFGDLMNGNWISGIKFIDEGRLGPQDTLPDKFKNNPARNKYYMLPLLFGIIGLIYQYNRDKRNFLVLSSFFILTGIAIVVYLNEIPVTPRERDYVYVGSFYAYSIFVGLGIMGFIRRIRDMQKSKILSILAMILIIFILPLNLISENWDDHDRSGRYTARDYAVNCLKSCDQNAILFTSADNDTYPLWYAQEVEEVRNDVRSVLLEFLPVGWYVEQLENDLPEKHAIDISFEKKDFLLSKRMFIPVFNRIDQYRDVKEIIQFVASDDPRSKISAYNEQMDYIPTKKFSLKVNKENFLKSMKKYKVDTSQVLDEIRFTINKQNLIRDELVVLNILANNDWERPIYFVNDRYMRSLGLGEYMHREGLVYRFMPFKTSDYSAELPHHFNADYSYNKLMNQFEWGNVEDPDVYLDWTNVRIVASFRLRSTFVDVARQYLSENNKEKAIELLDESQRLFIKEKVPYDIFTIDILETYFMADAKEKGMALFQELKDDVLYNLNYYAQLDEIKQARAFNEVRTELYMMQQLARISERFVPDESEMIMQEFASYYQMFIQQ